MSRMWRDGCQWLLPETSAILTVSVVHVLVTWKEDSLSPARSPADVLPPSDDVRLHVPPPSGSEASSPSHLSLALRSSWSSGAESCSVRFFVLSTSPSTRRAAEERTLPPAAVPPAPLSGLPAGLYPKSTPFPQPHLG